MFKIASMGTWRQKQIRIADHDLRFKIHANSEIGHVELTAN